MLSLLADPGVGPINPASASDNPDEYYKQPVSAGQYKVESFSRQDGSVALVQNDNYWGDKPSIPKIEFVAVSDTNTRILQLKSGEIDFAINIPPNTLSQLSGETEPAITPAYGGLYLYVSDRDAPLNDVRVRKAISMAIDRQRLSEVGFNGEAKPLYGFWASSFSWAEDVLPTAVDVTGAKQMLVGTPCESGCKLTVELSSGDSDNLALLIVEDLKAIGIDVAIRHSDAAVIADNDSTGNFQLQINGLTDYANRPDVMLTYGLQSDGGIEALFSGYNSSTMDSLIKQAVATSGDEGADLNKQINKQFAEDLPYIPLLDFVYVNGQRTSTTKWITQIPSSFFHITPKS